MFFSKVSNAPYPHTLPCTGEQFVYDCGLSVDDNFVRWRVANTAERDAWGEQPYTDEDARAAFHTALESGCLQHKSVGDREKKRTN